MFATICQNIKKISSFLPKKPSFIISKNLIFQKNISSIWEAFSANSCLQQNLNKKVHFQVLKTIQV